MSDFLQRAAAFAKGAHEGQVRKYTGEPYYNHCEAVAGLVYKHGGTDEMVAAAYLHDTVEDTDVTIEDLENNFPEQVWDYVDALTDVYTKQDYPDANRASRKRREAYRLSNCTIEVKVIKAFDMLDNTISIVEHDPKFAETYLKEKKYLMSLISDDVLLWLLKNPVNCDRTASYILSLINAKNKPD